MLPKDADGIANGTDPVQTAYSLFRVYIVRVEISDQGIHCLRRAVRSESTLLPIGYLSVNLGKLC